MYQNAVEDEIHFVISCPFYERTRSLYIDTTHRSQRLTDVQRLINILNSSNAKELKKLHLFLKEAYDLREINLTM